MYLWYKLNLVCSYTMIIYNDMIFDYPFPSIDFERDVDDSVDDEVGMLFYACEVAE